MTRQVSRLFGVGSEKLVLLDSKTKLLLKSYPASELHSWLPVNDAGGIGRRRCGNKHALTLEFRGTKSPWTVAPQSADAFKSVAAALWDMIGVGNQPADSGAVQRPFSADLLDFSTSFSFLAVCRLITHLYTFQRALAVCGRVYWTCNREVAGSLSAGATSHRGNTQPSIPPGSVNEYQLRLGRQRQVWLIPLADETQGVQVKL